MTGSEESPLDQEHRGLTAKRLYDELVASNDPLLKLRHRVTEWAIRQAKLEQLQGIAEWKPREESAEELGERLHIDWEQAGMPKVMSVSQPKLQVFQQSVARVYRLVKSGLQSLGVVPVASGAVRIEGM